MNKSVLVTGGNGILGTSLKRQLETQDYKCFLSSRHLRVSEGNWIRIDLCKPYEWNKHDFSYFIHAAPIWLLVRHIRPICNSNIKRIVAVSSSSAISKKASPDKTDRNMAKTLLEAEGTIKSICEDNNIKITIFRPTMIYGNGRDRNISLIAQFINRYGFFVVAGVGKGIRQPVHADDVAKVCVDSLNEAKTYTKIYTIAGGETMEFQDMVGKIFDVLGRKRRIIHMPIILYRIFLSLLSRRNVSPQAADRMNQDMAFNNELLEKDLGYRPTRFLPNGHNDLNLILSK